MRNHKTALLVAFHFPPMGESSGLQRTLSLANDLAEMGWKPIVLTVSKQAYRVTREDQLADIDDRIEVVRAFAVDASRSFAFRKKYPKVVALPDAWSSWILAGCILGLWLIWRHRPSFIWSTYPIASAHLLGLLLAKVSGTPWIADFRDSMTEDDYPKDRTQRRIYRWIERATVVRAHHCVFTTSGTLAMYEKRFARSCKNFCVIPNGFEERYFAALGASTARRVERQRDPIVLLHSGIVYPSERDPTHLFSALRMLKDAGINGTRLKIVLRASGFDETYRAQTKEIGIDDMVDVLPSVAYREALYEMTQVDYLLVLQGTNCNHQIPAKVYEYIRSGTPIVALTDPRGDTAQLMSETRNERVASLDDACAIRSLFEQLVVQGHPIHNEKPGSDVQKYSRAAHAIALTELSGELTCSDPH